MGNPKKLVIACQTCGYLIKDIANTYRAVGNDVTIMTSSDSQKSIKESLSKDIKLCPVIAYNRTTSFKRMLSWFWCAVQMLFKIGFRYRDCEVLYVSNPPLAPLLPLILRNNFSVLIWDIYPDVLVNQHYIAKDSFFARWWGRFNSKVYAKADKVFTISDGMKLCLGRYVSESKIKVVPLWPDNSNLQRIEKRENRFINNNHLEGKFVVMYSGNLGNTHRVDVIVDVAKQVTDDDIVFVLIGEGGKKKMIEQRVLRENVNNVLLLPYQPYSFLSHSLSAADIAVITLDTMSSQMSVPSKTFNMMSLGTPLMCIASLESELGKIVRKYKVGEIFPPEDVEGIIEFVLKLKRDDVLRKQFADNSLKASRVFSVDNARIFVER